MTIYTYLKIIKYIWTSASYKLIQINFLPLISSIDGLKSDSKASQVSIAVDADEFGSSKKRWRLSRSSRSSLYLYLINFEPYGARATISPLLQRCLKRHLAFTRTVNFSPVLIPELDLHKFHERNLYRHFGVVAPAPTSRGLIRLNTSHG